MSSHEPAEDSSRPASHRIRAGRAGAQPQEHHGRDSARQPDRHHRALGFGQVEPGLRHDLRGRAAPLHGVALQLRQAVRGAGVEAGRGLRLRPVAGHLDRAEDADQQPAIDGRDDDRHRELPQPALRDDRRAALPAHRRADAEPIGGADPRGHPVAAGRGRDRAAGAGLQGLRRGARLRVHRAPQERVPAADHRRQAGRHLRRDRSGRVRGRPDGRGRRSLRRRAPPREGDPRRYREHPAGGRRPDAGARREGRRQGGGEGVLRRAVQPRRITTSTARSDRPTSCSTIRRARAGPAAAWASTS